MIINIQPVGNIKKMTSCPLCSLLRGVVFLMFAGLLVLGIASHGLAADAETVPASDTARASTAPIVITGIAIEDNIINIKVQGPIKYTVYKPSDPFLVTVEIEGASIGQFRDKIISKSMGITEISPVQIEVPALAARLDILLQSRNDVRAEIKGDELVISVDSKAGGKAVANNVKPAVASGPAAPAPGEGAPREMSEIFADKGADKPAETEQPKDGTEAAVKDGIAREITELFFDKDKDIVELVIKADGKLGEPAVYQLDGTVILEIPAVKFKASMPSRMIAPVKDISIKSENEKLKIVITAQAGAQSEVYILDDELLVDFMAAGARDKKAVTEKGAIVQDKIVNGAKVISLDFQDADIVPILRLLGDVSGYNMVVHPEVKGKITMKLMNVPWTQALDIIIKTFNLEKVVEGNIIRIATVKAFQEEKKAMAENKELFGKAEDIVTRVFTVNYASVESLKGKDGKPDTIGLKELIEKGKLLSPRGTVSADARTRSLIIKDIQHNIDEVQKLLDNLDKPTKQVLIEARIIEIKTESAQSLGVEWGMSGKSKGVLGKGDSFNTQGSQGGTPSGGSSPTLFNLPALASTTAFPATGAITFGYMTADKTLGLDLRLSALGGTNKIKILASPKILTLDNQEAIIKQGQKIPITIPSYSNGVVTYTTTYIEATLKLTVTPQISPDGAVLMKLELIRDEPNEKTDIVGNPYIDIRLASSQVVLNNGETVVIGGIINNRDTKTGSNVPGISKLPVIGSLFKRDTDEVSNLELLIFLTPRLMQQ
jgi:type IV pilus assembly protein PilQ